MSRHVDKNDQILLSFSVTGLCVGIGFGISSKVYEDVKSVAKEPCKFDLIINYDHF